MAEFFVPDAMTVKLPRSGRTLKLWRGIHANLPHELVDHEIANELGIKPVHEMTDAEYRMIGMKRPVPKVPAAAALTGAITPAAPAKP